MSNLNLLKDQCSRLEGMRDVMIGQKASLILEINAAQSYLDTKDEVLSILTDVQEETQAKTKDLFENLLSALIKEVMGDRDENAKVVLSSTTKSNKVSLAIEIENSTGERRDVYLDKGGSVKNITAMGLRFIALSRTQNRRFIILDEADCWLNEKYIPGFANILKDLSVKIGMQVVYISHHNPEYFFGKAKIVNLTSHNGIVCSEEVEQPAEYTDGNFENKLDDSEVDDLMEGVGLRYLRLSNFKQHENTVIEFSPNVTVITGDNDIGKTTIVQAIEAVARNSGREGLIRDGQNSCRVEIGLEDGFSLEWGYKRTGSSKSRYILSDNNNVTIKESRSGTTTPEWLDQYLCMPLHKDIDINIGDQDSANFILDKSVSGFKKAEILSLGTDASKVQRLITKHGENILNCTKIINSKKKDLLAVKNKLLALKLLNSVSEKLNECSRIDELKSKRAISLASLRDKSLRIQSMTARLNAMASIANVSINQPSIDTGGAISAFEHIKKIEHLGKRYSALSSISGAFVESANFDFSKSDSAMRHIKTIGFLDAKYNAMQAVSFLGSINQPNTSDLNSLKSKAARIMSLGNKYNALSKVQNILIEAPNFSNVQNPERIGKAIVESMKKQSEIMLKISSNENILNAIADEKKILLDEMGHQCPLCNSVISELNHESV